MSYPIFLPKTSFAMKAKLAEREPSLIHLWQKIEVYRHIRETRKGRPLRLVHDGPPYTNGPIHLGHGLNKILKDFINRCQFRRGYDISFRPGWDCHGLPIEGKIEEEYRAKGKQKKDIDPSTLRKDCRDFSLKWVEIQKEAFQRLGILGEWHHPYLTMSKDFEAHVVHSVLMLLKKGYIYQGMRPVLWSTVEETALAEAEVEYKDMASTSMYVKFPLKNFKDVDHASILIWTTTPWSLPGNRAVCYAPDAVYVFVRVQEASTGLISAGEVLVMAQEALERVLKDLGVTAFEVIHACQGQDFSGVLCDHPLKEDGYAFDVPLLPGPHVEIETGTGLVHTAPGHGMEDFLIGKEHQLDLPETVLPNGQFCAHIPVFAGMNMWKSTQAIEEALTHRKALAASIAYPHSYPHSWRSKTPLCYRTTPQWFIALDEIPERGKPSSASQAHEKRETLRQQTLKEIRSPNVVWHPYESEERIHAMVETRPDWCISRQRLWGIPLPFFVHKQTQACLLDDVVFEKICQKVLEQGIDFWFTEEAWDVLTPDYSREDWVKITDIMDVWLESGLTHSAVLKATEALDFSFNQTEGGPSKSLEAHPQKDELSYWPSSYVLEGSDQHRGWFQSSLLTGVALYGRAPFKSVLTHGFLLDEQGRKQSKSLGNVVDPQDFVAKEGADILRLWVAHEDYQKDLRAGSEIFARVKDIYLRFRNTLRFLLGSSSGFSLEEWVPVSAMDPLEQWLFHTMAETHEQLEYAVGIERVNERTTHQPFNFQAYVRTLHQFCQKLSSFYFDVRKDALYCDAISAEKRKSARTGLLHALLFLCDKLAPVLCFTAEEAFQCLGRELFGIQEGQENLVAWKENPLLAKLVKEGLLEETPFWSLHLQSSITPKIDWVQEKSYRHVQHALSIRKEVNVYLEKARAEKRIGSSLEASVCLPQGMMKDLKGDLEFLREICIVSHVELEPASQETAGEELEAIKVVKSSGEKCARCWRLFPEVQLETALCERCSHVVGVQQA